MTDDLAIDPERLADAIDHLSPEQEQQLAQRAEVAGIRGGLKARIAGLAGLSSQTYLSDILGGRTSGATVRQSLERVLDLPPGWLAGATADVPDWKLPPLEAWLRWRSRLESAWERRLGRPSREDDSGISHLARGDEGQAAHVLQLPQGSALAHHLAAKDWARMTWEEIELIARCLRVPQPSHPGHLKAGLQLWKDIDLRVHHAVQDTKTRYERFLPPVRLFQLMRLALVGLRSQRQWQGKGSKEIDDALEILWRQQLLRAGRTKREMPAGFVRETGRSAWTPLRELQKSYGLQPLDYTCDYTSNPGPQPEQKK